MKISLMVEGQAGLTWERWQALAARVEQWGFAGLFRSDHFVMPSPPNENALEMIVSLAYLASHTQNIHFGPLVAPFSFREPVMLARQAAHIDALSGGRMILGVGAGWMTREHEMFGYDLLETRDRLDRFEEGLHVVWLLLKSDAPVTFEGKYYKLREAVLLPRPSKTKILVGGNGKTRTLPLAAKYADVWNGVGLDPEGFREHNAVLDGYLHAAGRTPNAVERTSAVFLYYGRDTAALEARVARMRKRPELHNTPLDELLHTLRTKNHQLAGTAQDVLPQIRAYAAAGVSELMVQILDSDDIEGLDDFAARVIPHIN